MFNEKKPGNSPGSRYSMTLSNHQISIEPISNDYDNQPFDITFLRNDIEDQFMVHNCWKKLLSMKRNQAIALEVGTA
jgi:hypothetical protein